MSIVLKAADLLIYLALFAGFIAQALGAYDTQSFVAIAAFLAASWAFNAKNNTEQ